MCACCHLLALQSAASPPRVTEATAACWRLEMRARHTFLNAGRWIILAMRMESSPPSSAHLLGLVDVV